jgi:hypothetical protein
MPERVDEVVYAELPDPSWDPTGELRGLVTGHISHGPCGEDDLRAPYIVRKYTRSPLTYSKRFPKAFIDYIIIYEDSYPEYCRRDNRQIFTARKPGFPDQQVVRNNCWIIPYNPYLLQKFRLYINIEIYASV